MNLNFYWLRQFRFLPQNKWTLPLPVIALLMTLMVANNAFSQDGTTTQKRTLHGKVTDSSGKPLSQVSVKVKGSNKGVVTNELGEYKINLPQSGKLLEFSYVGMNGQEVMISNQEQLNILMSPSASTEQDVVVV